MLTPSPMRSPSLSSTTSPTDAKHNAALRWKPSVTSVAKLLIRSIHNSYDKRTDKNRDDRLAPAKLVGELGLERPKDRVGIGRAGFGCHLHRIAPAGGSLRSGSRTHRHRGARRRRRRGMAVCVRSERQRLISDRRRRCGTWLCLGCRGACPALGGSCGRGIRLPRPVGADDDRVDFLRLRRRRCRYWCRRRDRCCRRRGNSGGRSGRHGRNRGGRSRSEGALGGGALGLREIGAVFFGGS
jgi:hypothetical protein